MGRNRPPYVVSILIFKLISAIIVLFNLFYLQVNSLLLPLSKKVTFLVVFVCLYVCPQDYLQNDERICMTLLAEVLDQRTIHYIWGMI